MFDVDISKGYVDMPVPEGIDLVSEIERMKREKNAVVLAHYYQSGDLQDIADYVGDSLALAQWAAKTDASILVLCGVHFMGETAKIICPDKKVLIPDMNAGCSLADSCPADAFAEFVKAHPGTIYLFYIPGEPVSTHRDTVFSNLLFFPMKIGNARDKLRPIITYHVL